MPTFAVAIDPRSQVLRGWRTPLTSISRDPRVRVIAATRISPPPPPPPEPETGFGYSGAPTARPEPRIWEDILCEEDVERRSRMLAAALGVAIRNGGDPEKIAATLALVMEGMPECDDDDV